MLKNQLWLGGTKLQSSPEGDLRHSCIGCQGKRCYSVHHSTHKVSEAWHSEAIMEEVSKHVKQDNRSCKSVKMCLEEGPLAAIWNISKRQCEAVDG